MLKLVLIVALIVLAIIGIKKIIDGIKVSSTLITYNGRTCDYWEYKLWPDEYIRGWVYKTAKLKARIDLRTGYDQEITPPQAAALIDWIFENYPVTTNGASLSSSSKTLDSNNHQNTIIWHFDKAPSGGITAQTQRKLIDGILSECNYVLVDKWPLKPEKFIDDHQEQAKQIVLTDLGRKGF